MNSVIDLIAPPASNDAAIRPLMNKLGDMPDMPDVPQMIVEGQRRAQRPGRLDELVGIADFIGNANLLECKHIITELIERVSTLTGCAVEMEDAGCVLTREIEAEAMEGRN